MKLFTLAPHKWVGVDVLLICCLINLIKEMLNLLTAHSCIRICCLSHVQTFLGNQLFKSSYSEFESVWPRKSFLLKLSIGSVIKRVYSVFSCRQPACWTCIVHDCRILVVFIASFCPCSRRSFPMLYVAFARRVKRPTRGGDQKL